MSSAGFTQRVDAIDRRVRESEPGAAAEIVRKPGSGDTVTWARDDAWATLTLHEAGRLELTLHTNSDHHPQTLEVRVDDADANELIAKAVAAQLTGKQQ